MGPQFSFRTVTSSATMQPMAKAVAELQEEEREEEDSTCTAVLSPSHDLSDLLEICELSAQTSPLSTAEGNTERLDPATDQGENLSLLI